MMIKFYIGDALIYPIEASREQVREGFYIPLIGGSLLLAYEEEGDIWMKMLQGSGGTIYGINEDGKWAKEIGGAAIDGVWPEGVEKEDAFAISATKVTREVGSMGTAVSVLFSQQATIKPERGSISPEEASVQVGKTQVFRLVGIPVGQSVYASANGANVKLIGDQVHVTPTQHEEHVYVNVSVKGEIDTYNLSAVLTPMMIEEGESEAPVPPEPVEPSTENIEEVQFTTVETLARKVDVQEPVLRKVTHRSRGPREAEKLNAYLIGMRHELNELNERESEIRLLQESPLEGSQVAVSLIDDERIVFLEKPVGVKLLRVGVRAQRVTGTSVKFNGTSLNSSDYTMDVHGIMTLSDQYTERSGRIEVELSYERHNESPDRLTMDELKRRARRLDERMCQVREGIENE